MAGPQILLIGRRTLQQLSDNMADQDVERGRPDERAPQGRVLEHPSTARAWRNARVAERVIDEARALKSRPRRAAAHRRQPLDRQGAPTSRPRRPTLVLFFPRSSAHRPPEPHHSTGTPTCRRAEAARRSTLRIAHTHPPGLGVLICTGQSPPRSRLADRATDQERATWPPAPRTLTGSARAGTRRSDSSGRVIGRRGRLEGQVRRPDAIPFAVETHSAHQPGARARTLNTVRWPLRCCSTSVPVRPTSWARSARA